MQSLLDKNKYKIFRYAVFLLSIFFILDYAGDSVYASGFFNAPNFTPNKEALNERYNLSNYMLDYYGGSKWSDLLPWNWGDGIGKIVLLAVYGITNMLFAISVFFSKLVNSIVGFIFSFDFIDKMADKIGDSIGRFAGVGRGGIVSGGFLASFLIFAIVFTGIYLFYKAGFKKQTSSALSSLLHFILVFFIVFGVMVNSKNVIKQSNKLSNEIGSFSLSIASSMTKNGGSNLSEVDNLKDTLWSLQVYQPWYLLQYGDTKSIDEKKDELLKLDYSSDEREALVDKEVEDRANKHLTTSEVFFRFGAVFLILIFNLVVSVFVLLLCFISFMSQLTFIFYMLLFPIMAIFSLFPSQSHLLQKAIFSLLNSIISRAVILFIVSMTFALASLIYSYSQDMSFAAIMFFQFCIFGFSFVKLPEMLSYLSFGKDGSMAGAVNKGNRYIRDKSIPIKQTVASFVGNTLANKVSSRESEQRGKVYNAKYPDIPLSKNSNLNTGRNASNTPFVFGGFNKGKEADKGNLKGSNLPHRKYKSSDEKVNTLSRAKDTGEFNNRIRARKTGAKYRASDINRINKNKNSSNTNIRSNYSESSIKNTNFNNRGSFYKNRQVKNEK